MLPSSRTEARFVLSPIHTGGGILIVIKKDKAKDNCIQITVHGGWGNWKSVSVDHCINEPDGKVKQIRYCDNPLPKYGGDLCPEPDLNERFISCNATNYQGMILF